MDLHPTADTILRMVAKGMPIQFARVNTEFFVCGDYVSKMPQFTPIAIPKYADKSTALGSLS